VKKAFYGKKGNGRLVTFHMLTAITSVIVKLFRRKTCKNGIAKAKK
jgi:hypothetical protein